MQSRVPPERAGERLDQVLADHVGSRAHAQRLIDEGRVTVDGEPRPKSHRVTAGETVVWEAPEAPPAPEPLPDEVPFGVAYEDEHLLVGGAVGNIFDRIRDGAVTDFLKIPAWPAFNIADVAITVGVVVLAFVLERRDDPEPDPDPA